MIILERDQLKLNRGLISPENIPMLYVVVVCSCLA